LQNTPTLSVTVAHLGLAHQRVRPDRPASDPVVVSLVVSDHVLGLFVPNPSPGEACQGRIVLDLGQSVRECPWASTAVGGGCYSLGYSVASEPVKMLTLRAHSRAHVPAMCPARPPTLLVWRATLASARPARPGQDMAAPTPAQQAMVLPEHPIGRTMVAPGEGAL
jgi:hypothetical protein